MAGYSEDNVFVITEIDDQVEQLLVPLTKEIQNQTRRAEENRRIDLYINSYGGYLTIIQHFVDLVERAKDQGIVVRTIVPAVAFSAGSMLAITGTPGERYIGRVGEHLIHYGRQGSVEETPLQAQRNHESRQRSFKSIKEHYEKYCDIPNLDNEMMDDGFYLPAAKCIKFGLADKYTDKLKV